MPSKFEIITPNKIESPTTRHLISFGTLFLTIILIGIAIYLFPPAIMKGEKIVWEVLSLVGGMISLYISLNTRPI